MRQCNDIDTLKLNIAPMTEEHLELYRAYHEARGASKLQPRPKTMLAALDSSGCPVAFAGLVRTDSTYCLIDAVTTNPRASEDQIEQALALLYLNLGGLAFKSGYKKLLFTTRFKRLKSHGIMFNATPLSAETYSVDLEVEAPKYGFSQGGK